MVKSTTDVDEVLTNLAHVMTQNFATPARRVLIGLSEGLQRPEAAPRRKKKV